MSIRSGSDPLERPSKGIPSASPTKVPSIAPRALSLTSSEGPGATRASLRRGAENRGTAQAYTYVRVTAYGLRKRVFGSLVRGWAGRLLPRRRPLAFGGYPARSPEIRGASRDRPRIRQDVALLLPQPAATKALRASILTHSNHPETAAAVRLACEIARRTGAEIVISPDEAVKHRRDDGPKFRVQDDATTCCDVLIALGGDGTTLRALHAALPKSPPVFTINFGSLGFLRTAERKDLKAALTCALTGDFDTMVVPALRYQARGVDGLGFNDVLVRPPGHSIADLSVAIDGQCLGTFRSDGIIAATPVGSTGYNLAAGGPALAWGVEGYVVSLLNPHSVAHRPVVAGPHHKLEILDAGVAPAELIVDGNLTAQLSGDDRLTVQYQPSAARLARLADGGFFSRFDEKFGSRS